jgi:hypothetical protein
MAHVRGDIRQDVPGMKQIGAQSQGAKRKK